jgi:hypothetical protein
MTIFYCLRFVTPPTWRARYEYLHVPGTGWPGYTVRHWVPFSSPPTIRRARWRYLNPPPHGVSESTGLESSLYSLGADTTETPPVSIVTVLLRASRFRGKVLTEPFLRNGLHIPVVLLLRACTSMLRTLRSNCHCLQNRRLATVLHFTIFSTFPQGESEILLVILASLYRLLHYTEGVGRKTPQGTNSEQFHCSR